MLKGVFRHFLHSSESRFKIERIGKTKASLGDILIANNASECVQTIKQIWCIC